MVFYVFYLQINVFNIYGFVVRRCVSEIQDGSQITGSINNFLGFTDTLVVWETIQGFMIMYKTSKCLAIKADATSKIQHSSQLTGSSNILVTMTHIIKISTSTTMFLGQAFLVVLLPISWDVDVC